MTTDRRFVLVPRDYAPIEMWSGFRSVNCKCGTDGLEEFTYFHGDLGNWQACYAAMLSAIPQSVRELDERRQDVIEAAKQVRIGAYNKSCDCKDCTRTLAFENALERLAAAESKANAKT